MCEIISIGGLSAALLVYETVQCASAIFFRAALYSTQITAAQYLKQLFNHIVFLVLI